MGAVNDGVCLVGYICIQETSLSPLFPSFYRNYFILTILSILEKPPTLLKIKNKLRQQVNYLHYKLQYFSSICGKQRR